MSDGDVVVLTGGVGGAKLVLGLTEVIAPSRICAIVNVGDDFRHLGLAVSPDLDTLLYTLAGKAHEAQGWGFKDETWTFMQQLRSLGGPEWFSLGDGDLALHVLRTAKLAQGESLSRVTSDFARAWNVRSTLLPASDDPLSTMLDTDEGELGFQAYFVERRCRPAVRRIRFSGAENSRPAPGVLDAIGKAETIIIAPSNPYLSIDPILAVPGIVAALRETEAPVVAVSPVIGGNAVKGPTAKIMAEMDLPVRPETIARHYAPLLDGLLLDERDDGRALALPFAQTDTLMTALEDKARVAKAVLDLASTVTA